MTYIIISLFYLELSSCQFEIIFLDVHGSYSVFIHLIS